MEVLMKSTAAAVENAAACLGIEFGSIESGRFRSGGIMKSLASDVYDGENRLENGYRAISIYQTKRILKASSGF